MSIPPLSDNKVQGEGSYTPQRQNSSSLWWLWLALGAMAAAFLWGTLNWYEKKEDRRSATPPFQRISNRQMSLFLWQFPEYMRTNVSVKEGYLPGFEYGKGKVNILPGYGGKMVIAPPALLFLYHVWMRQIRDEVPIRSFKFSELRDFLQFAPEWNPANWPEASDNYRLLVARLPTFSVEDFDKVVPDLPWDVQVAMTGWKNYTQEQQAIDTVAPTYKEMGSFLIRYPHYARNYWRNIVMPVRPNYLETFTKGKYQPDAVVPSEEMTRFLKAAIYNAKQAGQS